MNPASAVILLHNVRDHRHNAAFSVQLSPGRTHPSLTLRHNVPSIIRRLLTNLGSEALGILRVPQSLQSRSQLRIQINSIRAGSRESLTGSLNGVLQNVLVVTVNSVECLCLRQLVNLIHIPLLNPANTVKD